MTSKSYGLLFNDGSSEIKIKGLHIDFLTFQNLKKKFYANETLIIDTFAISNKQFHLFQKIKNLEVLQTNSYSKRIFSIDKKSTYPLKLKI